MFIFAKNTQKLDKFFRTVLEQNFSYRRMISKIPAIPLAMGMEWPTTGRIRSESFENPSINRFSVNFEINAVYAQLKEGILTKLNFNFDQIGTQIGFFGTWKISL